MTSMSGTLIVHFFCIRGRNLHGQTGVERSDEHLYAWRPSERPYRLGRGDHSKSRSRGSEYGQSSLAVPSFLSVVF